MVQRALFDFWPHQRWPPNSPDLNPLDYCVWSELGEQMNWSRVVNRETLIDEVKRSVKEIRVVIVRRSVTSWTNRVYKM